MAHKHGFLTIQQRMEQLVDVLSVVPAASVSALAKRQLCSESTIRNALNYMLSIGQVTRRQEDEAEMWKRVAQERKYSYMKSPSARPQWMYSLVKEHKNVQLDLIPRTLNQFAEELPDE